MGIEKRADISPESTPQKEVPPTDRTTDPVHGLTRQVPSPPKRSKHGQSADDIHPTAAELRDELEAGPQKRLADRAAERLP
jgi:hypothetical protein